MSRKWPFERLIKRVQVSPELSWGLLGPTLTLAYSVKEQLNDDQIDQRIARLARTREDLLDAVKAVRQLETEAQTRKDEVAELRASVAELEQDQDSIATTLALDQESFARVLNDATKQTAHRGLVTGTLIGLVTGFLSSFAVWLLTT